jgi:hypothetical protein
MATVTVTNIERANGGNTREIPVSASASPTALWKPIAAIAAIGAVAFVMWLAYADWIKPAVIQLKASYVPFAGVVVVAAALERLLEPLSDVLLPKDPPKQQAAQTKTAAQAAAADPDENTAQVKPLVDKAAKKQAAADARPMDRTIMFWVIASACGLVLAGSFGFFLLQPVASNHVNRALDLVVTGLAIGAGTKPLHDLITNIQSKGAASGSA